MKLGTAALISFGSSPLASAQEARKVFVLKSHLTISSSFGIDQGSCQLIFHFLLKTRR